MNAAAANPGPHGSSTKNPRDRWPARTAPQRDDYNGPMDSVVHRFLEQRSFRHGQRNSHRSCSRIQSRKEARYLWAYIHTTPQTPRSQEVLDLARGSTSTRFHCVPRRSRLIWPDFLDAPFACAGRFKTMPGLSSSHRPRPGAGLPVAFPDILRVAAALIVLHVL